MYKLEYNYYQLHPCWYRWNGKAYKTIRAAMQARRDVQVTAQPPEGLSYAFRLVHYYPAQ